LLDEIEFIYIVEALIYTVGSKTKRQIPINKNFFSCGVGYFVRRDMVTRIARTIEAASKTLYDDWAIRASRSIEFFLLLLNSTLFLTFNQ
jgi:hypothetical protein